MKLTNTYKILNEGTALGMELERQVEDGGRGAERRGRRIKKTVFALPLGTFSLLEAGGGQVGICECEFIHPGILSPSCPAMVRKDAILVSSSFQMILRDTWTRW